MILFSNINKAHDLVKKVISGKLRNPYAERIEELTRDYKIAITGEGYDYWLKRFEKRETAEDFEYRKLVTSKVFKAALGNVLNTLNKLTAIKDINKYFSFVDGTDDREQKSKKLGYLVNEMFGGSYENFVRDNLLPKSNRDPNSFYVILFQKQSKGVKMPYLKYVPSSECAYYKYDNNKLQYLIIKEQVADFNKKGKEKIYNDYTIYAGEVVIEYKMILQGSENVADVSFESYRDGLENTGNVKSYTDENKNVYRVYEYNTGAKQVQAYRIGYKFDSCTDENTCVSVWDDALPIIKRLVDVVSQSDVSRAEHAFPKYLTFYSPCDYIDEEHGQCDGGTFPDQTICPKCKGSGRSEIKTEQDSLQIKFPEDVSEVFDIAKIATYVPIPINGIEFFDKLEQRLERRIYAAVYNAEMAPHSSLTAVGDSVTATEVTTTRSDIINTLILTASMISDFIKFAFNVSKDYVFNDNNSSFVVNYIFPNDLKLSSVEDLLGQLKLAKEANAPAFIIEELSMGVARKLNDGDVIAIRRINLKKKFIPFFEKDFNFVEKGLQNNLILPEDAFVYFNQESIFTDIEESVPGFYFLNDVQQKEKLVQTIQTYISKWQSNQKSQQQSQQTQQQLQQPQA